MTKEVWKKSDDSEVKAFASKVEGRVRAKAPDGKMRCVEAFALAREENVSISRIGEVLNELEVKVANCQLGCFE